MHNSNTPNTSNSLWALCQLMRWHKPIGILLLLWPTWWALWLAKGGMPSLRLLIVFSLGVILMRSAGCVINDWADRHWDGAVTRTKMRPLVTGQVSPSVAIGLFTVLCLIAASLLPFLNAAARWLAIPAVLLAIIYPFCKRFMQAPQLILGLAFSWGIPMVFAATQGHVSVTGWWLFATACLWPIAYDTIYAMVDRPDDHRVGIRSTAIWLGKWDTTFIAVLHALLLASLAILGLYQHLSIFYALGLIAAASMMAYQQYLIRNREPALCLRAFMLSHWVGFCIWLGLAAS